MVLDVMMPGINGFEVVRRMTAEGNRCPVLFLTARDAVEDKITGLTVGGDDYVTKPFSLDEVLARIRAVLRRSALVAAAQPAPRLAFADLEVSLMLRARGARNHAINGGGDARLAGDAAPGRPWTFGIADPHDRRQVIATVSGRDFAVATSGTTERGAHIVGPFTGRPPAGLLSATATGPSLTFADAYATAAFVMGEDALRWIGTQHRIRRGSRRCRRGRPRDRHRHGCGRQDVNPLSPARLGNRLTSPMSMAGLSRERATDNWHGRGSRWATTPRGRPEERNALVSLRDLWPVSRRAWRSRTPATRGSRRSRACPCRR